MLEGSEPEWGESWAKSLFRADVRESKQMQTIVKCVNDVLMIFTNSQYGG